jgi:uncharacterized membrane protein
MTLKLKNKLLKLSVLLLIAPGFMPAVAFAAPEIDNAACAGSNITITANPSNDACEDINKDGAETANNLVATIINIISVVVGIVAVIMIIYAGFRYVTSGGRDDSVKGAKNTILYAIIGLVVVALAQIIVHFVLNKTTQATTSS